MRRRLFWLALSTLAMVSGACGASSSSSPLTPGDGGIADATLLDSATDGDGETLTDAGTDASHPLPKGARVLGLDINSAQNNDYIGALALAQEAGAQATNVSLNWEDIELAPGDAGADAGIGYYNPYLHIANLVFPPSHVQVSLAIRPIDTSQKHVPADLAGKTFDDPIVIDRFNRLQDYVFSALPDVSFVTYVIGNEVDVFLGTDATAWAQYKTFYEATSAHARTLLPGIKVGAAATLSGYTGASKAQLAALNATSDVIAVTYYPLNADFTVRPVASVQTDIESLLALFPGKSVHFREAGYPSGPGDQSSEAAQADFVREAFRVWDLHGDRVPLITFFTMHEYPPATVDTLAMYYGVSDPKFKEYLRTVGLRTSVDAGTDKPAFQALAVEAHARGW